MRRTCVLNGGRVMRRRRGCPVLIELGLDRYPAGIKASSKADPAEVSLALREEGWSPYRIKFDAGENMWIASVIYRRDAARLVWR